MSKDTHSPLNLSSTQSKDNLKFNPKEIILSSLPCVSSPRNKAVKVSLFDMVTGYTDEAKRGTFGIYRGTANKAKKAKFKTHDVRAFTISIGFDGQPTGVLAVDIDHVSERYNKTTHEIIQLICQYFPVMVGATSFGGDGVFILMRYPKENNLVAVFKAIAEDFDMFLDIEIDFLADLQRLRIDTFDPEVFINWDAGIYDGIAIEETPAPATKEESNNTLDSRSPIGAISFNNAGMKVFPIINPLMAGRGLTVTKAKSKDEVYCYQGGGHSPRTIVAKFHEGIIFFIVKSSTFAKEWDIEEKGYNAYDWHKILTGFTDFDAQKELAKLGFGEWNEPQIIATNSKESYSNTIDFLETKNLRLNQLTGFVEIAGSPLNDTHTAQLITELSLLSGKNQSREILQTCIAVVGNKNQFHPFMEMIEELKQLPATDFTQATYLDKLNDCFTSTTPKELRLIYLSRWMLGLFDLHILQRMTKNVLILSGSQNSGKTSYAKNVLPEPLKHYAKTVEFNINKMVDAKVNLCSTLVSVFDEFEDILTKSKNLSDFKNLTSSYDILERRPYRRNPEQMYRSSIIMATTNEQNILNDSTGNTRFLTIDVQGFDFKKYNSLDMLNVWRAIYDLHLQGQTSVLNEAERALQVDENINFESEDFVIGLIEKSFYLDESGFITSTDILVELEKNTRQHLNLKRIGQALRKMGIERVAKKVKGKVLRGYNLKFSYEA